MSAEIKDYMSSCLVCNTLRSVQCQEPLSSHDIPNWPWSKVATDLFAFNGDNYIMAVDYYSNFLEVDCLRSTSSSVVIQSLKVKYSLQGMAYLMLCQTIALSIAQMNFISLHQHGSSNTLLLPHTIRNLMAKQKVLLKYARPFWRSYRLQNQIHIYLARLLNKQTYLQHKDFLGDKPTYSYLCLLLYSSLNYNSMWDQISCWPN